MGWLKRSTTYFDYDIFYLRPAFWGGMCWTFADTVMDEKRFLFFVVPIGFLWTQVSILFGVYNVLEPSHFNVLVVG